MYICICLYMYICIYVYMCTCIYVYMYICIRIYIFIYVYTYIYTRTYIYRYIYVHLHAHHSTGASIEDQHCRELAVFWREAYHCIGASICWHITPIDDEFILYRCANGVMRMEVHIYIYMYIYICIYIYIYIYIVFRELVVCWSSVGVMCITPLAHQSIGASRQ